MPVTRINNNQITDAVAGNLLLGVNAAAKLQNYSITSTKIANNLTYGSDLTISGNLTVNGTTTAIDTVNTLIEDPLITLADGQTAGSPTVDIGTIGLRGSELSAVLGWKESQLEFVTVLSNTTVSNTTFNINTYANLRTGNAVVQGTTSLVGNVIGAANFTGNITGGNLLTAGLVSATGNVTGGNVNTGGQVVATSNITGGNLLTGGQISATGNITGGNIISGNAIIGNINVSGDITVNSLTSNTYVSATGNVQGGNVRTTGIISASGTITGGNLVTGGTASVTGTATVGNLATGGTMSATGNVTGGNVLTGGLISATATITGGNLATGGTASATGNITGGNIITSGVVNTPTVTNATAMTISTSAGDIALNAAGNINASSNYINNVLDPVAAQDAATKQYVDDAVSAGLTVHTPVYVESPTALNATYAQGGNTFTVNQTIAGNTVVFTTAANLQVNDQLWFTSSFQGILGNVAYFVVSAPNTSAAVLSTSYNGAPVSNITSATGLTQGVRVNSGIGATLTNAGTNATITIDGVTLSNTQRVLVYTQANAAHNGVYVVSNAGNATSAWVLTRSTDTDVYGPKSTEELDVGDYFYVQAGDTGAGESYVMTAPTGPFIIGYSNLTFTQFSASQVYSANTAAGLSLTGTVFSAKVDNNTTAFDGGGNISVKPGANLTTPNIGAATGTSLSLTGAVTAASTVGGVITGTSVSVTGGVTAASVAGGVMTGTSASLSGNVTGGNVLTGGLISATATITGGNLATGGTMSATGNVTGGNVLTGGLISATGDITTAANISGGNANITTQINTTSLSASGNIRTAGTVSATGNIDGGNLRTAGLITATGNITGGNLILTTGIIDGPASGRITINGSDIDTDFAVDGDTTANVFYVDAGTGTASFGSSTQTTNAIVAFNASTSVLMPVGNTAQRPGTGVTGMLRFNSTTNGMEVYDNSAWTSVGQQIFTVVGDEQFNGDGVTTQFTLSSTQTTNSCIVSINGVVQIPTLAYSVAGTNPTCVLTFTEAPASGDLIDVRQITTTTTVTGFSSGTSNVLVATNGDITFSSSGVSNIIVASGSSNTVSINGNLTVSGNATLSGNILGDRIQNGSTTIDIQTPSGNANITIAGTSNVAVFNTGGLVMTGNITPSANITYDLGTSTQRWKDLWLSNSTIYLGNAQISANATSLVFTSPTGGQTVFAGVSGNITVGNIINQNANAVGNIGSSTGYFNTVFAKATSAQYADLAEKYTADATYAPGTVVMFGGTAEVTLCVNDGCPRVAGVVSTNPSYRMNDGLQSEYTAMVALTGRVPTKVTGTVRKGDLMVSAGNGVARAEANPQIGTVIGKSLVDSEGDAVIEIVVGRV